MGGQNIYDIETRFAIFRAQNASSESEAHIMRYEPMTATEADGGQRAIAAGMNHGHDLKVLFSMPGLSLVYAWFKSGFPLPRHTHDVDCLYYIVGGSLRIGDQELHRGDGFFIGHGIPYAYTAGPAGVEVLEFRASNAFNIKLMANNPAFWDRAIETVSRHRDSWERERRPGLDTP
jgi:hypothetical protein